MNTIQSISAISAAVLAVALSACGASEPAPVQPTPAPAADPATPVATDTAAKPHHEEGEHDFPAAVTAFHDLMAPKWHAEPGAQRQTDTCGALVSFKDAATKIGSDPVPDKAAAQEGSWHNAVADLNISIGGLEAACKVDGRPDFQTAFHEVHEAFHRLVALVGHEKHEEGAHEGHEDHGKHKGHEKHEGHEDHGKHKGHDKH